MKPQNFSTKKKVGALIVIVIILIIIWALTAGNNNQIPGDTTDMSVSTSTIDMGSTTSNSTSTAAVSGSTTVSPAMTISTAGWTSLSSSTTGITFKYPTTAQLGLNYIQTAGWPPAVAVTNDPFTCTQSGSAATAGGKTSIEMINNNEYCLNVQGQGAAGSVYNQYAYSFPQDGKTLVLSFTLRYPQCANYSDPAMTSCKNEESAFSVDQLANAIAQSVQYVRLIAPAQPAQPVSSSSAPIQLDLVSPTYGKVGSTITLTGKGFLANNKVLFNSGVAASEAQPTYISNAGQSLTITVPSAMGADCQTNAPCPMYALLVTPATYQIVVENDNGKSNSIPFTVIQ